MSGRSTPPTRLLVLIGAAITTIAAAAALPGRAAAQTPPPAALPHVHTAAHDSSFAALQRRGKSAMGVDQYTSVHRFDDLADGGRIELQRAAADPAGVRAIREHLRSIVAAFSSGDFSTPAFVHMQHVPGTSVMAARRSAIRYEFGELPLGGAVRITSTDPEAVRAVHEFLAFQRSDHRTEGAAPHGASHGASHGAPATRPDPALPRDTGSASP